MSAIVLESVLTCPRCGFAKPETMPTDACQFYYECSNCKALLRPNPGDCCVFCSFGSVGGSQVVVWITQWPQLAARNFFRYRKGIPPEHVDVLVDQRR
ncbi:GDCCVxC domain-containing (seleno)protein [Pseudomonas aeruginosa]|uniref:GDCCVxC domain-containing (seleno)protein n=1 Tax=Pseudomonas aeruginosa TaxID=287 RepID=UPI000A6AA961